MLYQYTYIQIYIYISRQYVHVLAHAYSQTYIYTIYTIYTHVNICTRTNIHIRTDLYIYVSRQYVHDYTYTHIRHTSTYTCICIYTFSGMKEIYHAYVHMYVNDKFMITFELANNKEIR